jgi:hypothetical protein
LERFGGPERRRRYERCRASLDGMAKSKRDPDRTGDSRDLCAGRVCPAFARPTSPCRGPDAAGCRAARTPLRAAPPPRRAKPQVRGAERSQRPEIQRPCDSCCADASTPPDENLRARAQAVPLDPKVRSHIGEHERVDPVHEKDTMGHQRHICSVAWTCRATPLEVEPRTVDTWWQGRGHKIGGPGAIVMAR